MIGNNLLIKFIYKTGVVMKKNYENEIENYINFIVNNEENNLFEKLGNIAILYYYSLYKNKNNKSSKNYYFLKSRKKLEEVFKQENVFNFQLGMPYGLVYLGYVTRSLNVDNSMDDKINKIDYLINYYSKKIIEEYDYKKYGMETSFYDIIYGVAAVAHYYHWFGKNNIIRIKIIEWLVQLYIDKINFSNCFFIKNENIRNYTFKKRFDDGYIDMSFSHGIAGVLLVLSEAYVDGIEVSNLEEIIKDIYSEYVLNMKIIDNIISFPCLKYFSDKEVKYDYDEKYSWCYGSLGISKVMYNVSKIFNDGLSELLIHNTSFEVIEKIELLNYKTPIFCHGYAGAYHILGLYDIPNFENKKQILIDKIINFYGDNLNFEIFKINNKNLIIKNNIIDGFGSIIIPLLIGIIGEDNGFYSKMIGMISEVR